MIELLLLTLSIAGYLAIYKKEYMLSYIVFFIQNCLAVAVVKQPYMIANVVAILIFILLSSLKREDDEPTIKVNTSDPGLVTDNFDIISEMIEDSDEHFYMLQIIKRKKEHPEIGSNNLVIHTYYIRNKEHLYRLKAEIVMLCTLHNARAYINLNRRNYERIAFHNLKKVTDQIMNKEYNSIRHSYSSVVGMYSDEPNKKWIIDIDYNISQEEFFNIMNFINDLEPHTGDSKLKRIVPTKNGVHLIVSPFNTQKFSNAFSYDVHKNNPTLIFCP